jgi:prophage regulatory protein
MHALHPAETPTPSRRARGATATRAPAARGDQADRIIREPECEKITGLSRSTRWRLERDGMFPRRRRISPGCSGWLWSEIHAWITARTSVPTRPAPLGV